MEQRVCGLVGGLSYVSTVDVGRLLSDDPPVEESYKNVSLVLQSDEPISQPTVPRSQ